MQLIFSDEYYDTVEYGKGNYARKLKKELSDIDPEVQVSDADIGRGADWPVVLVEFLKELDWSSLLTSVGAGGLFLAGKKINESIEGWIEIAKKLKNVINRFKPVRIDEHVAVLIVLDKMEEKLNKNSFKLTVQVQEFTPTPWNEHKLSNRPDALYIITIEVLNQLYIHGIKSNGEIVFQHNIDTTCSEFDK